MASVAPRDLGRGVGFIQAGSSQESRGFFLILLNLEQEVF